MAPAGKQPRRKAAKGHQLPEPISEGLQVTDTTKKTWIISKIIGSGGFGTVYYAADAKNPKDNDYVIKIEFHANGPLFAEMHCYQKIAKPSALSEWIKKKKLNYLGLSPCYGFGSFEYNNSKYRFMVLERFDKDLQKYLDEGNKKFPLETVCWIGLSVLDVLEYIHSCGYVHGDIKAANLLIGRKKGTENQVYLVDMGLACKYIKDGVHKADIPDPRKAHNGTPEYTSRDAHRGSFSRRSDVEILIYNLLHWLSGKLPWEKFISDNNKLQKEKEKYMSSPAMLLKELFDDNYPKSISRILQYVCELSFDDEPNYDYCRQLLKDELKTCGSKSCILKFTDTVKSVATSSASSQESNKENGKKPTVKSYSKKRKEVTKVEFEPGMILTPAMEAVLNKKITDGIPKTRRKV